MKVTNKIYSSIYGLKKIEATASANRDNNSGSSVSLRNKSFAEIQSKMNSLKSESGFQSKIDPRIAIALTAANSDQAFTLAKNKNNRDVDIFHDHSENRGKTTNIEI